MPIITHTVYKLVEKQPKHVQKVMHHHHHDGHVAHTHKHEGDVRHKHKHRGTGGHRHSHTASGEHKHWHLGKAQHGHSHKGHGTHEHRHKGHRGHREKQRGNSYSHAGFSMGSGRGHRVYVYDDDGRFEPYKNDYESVNDIDPYPPAFYSNTAAGNEDIAFEPVTDAPPYGFYPATTSSQKRPEHEDPTPPLYTLYSAGKRPQHEDTAAPPPPVSKESFNLFTPEETAELENSWTNFDEFGETGAKDATNRGVGSTYDENETEPERGDELRASKTQLPYRDENYGLPIVPYEVTEIMNAMF